MIRSGAASLAELILVLALFALVSAGAARFASGQRRVAETVRTRGRWAELVRTATLVLGADSRFLVGADIAAAAGDSIRIRAFRGGGLVCGTNGPRVWLRYTGAREPEPAKDSLLLLLPDTMVAVRLQSVAASDSCGSSLRLTLELTPPGPAGYGLIFESGAYMLAGNAFRYRRGAGGRQPLTETLLDVRSRLAVDTASVRLWLAPGPAWRSEDAYTARPRLPTLNRPADGA